MNQKEIVNMFSGRAAEMIAKWPEENGRDPLKVPQLNPEIVIELAKAEQARRKIASVLDFGGGFGRWVPFWSRGIGAPRYTLIEPCPEFAAEAERRHEAAAGVEIMQGDLLALDAKLGKRKWDLLFTFTALEHVVPAEIGKVAAILKARTKRMILIEMTVGTAAAGFCDYVFKHDYKKLFGEPRFERMVDANKTIMLW